MEDFVGLGPARVFQSLCGFQNFGFGVCYTVAPRLGLSIRVDGRVWSTPPLPPSEKATEPNAALRSTR